MSDKPPLPPGQLPNITDTDPPPLHPATEVGDGYVRVNEEKLAEVQKLAAAAAQHAHGARHPQQEPAGKH